MTVYEIYVCKNLPVLAISFLTKLFDHCFRTGYFPDEWKVARVVPIAKPGKPASRPDSYRPISLLCGLSKILEKLIKVRLVDYLDSHSVLPSVQYGFRSGLNCTIPCSKLKNFIKENLENKQSVGLVTLDIEAAFDTVWHEGLVYKLITIDGPLYLIHIIKNFLKQRSFYIDINSAHSTQRHILAGVPQGSVLGPILFNIYTHDIPQVSDCKLSLFADDAAIYTTGLQYNSINNSMQNYLYTLEKYYHKWKIKINPNKTSAIFFTKRRKSCYIPNSCLHICNTPIEWANNIRYLGIHFDKRLTFQFHVGHAIDKINKTIRLLYPIINRKSKLSNSNKLIIFKTIFRPSLVYGSSIWGKSASAHIKKIQICQNKLLKLLLNLPYYTGTLYLHSIANVPTVKQYLNLYSN